MEMEPETPTKIEIEKDGLEGKATQVMIYLVVSCLASFIFGFILLDETGRFAQLMAIALIGFSGSAAAALVSCLNRYATGFELESGEKIPAEAKGETFNRRMSRWFVIRPFLGFVVAPVFIWGISFFVKEPEQFKGSEETLAFTAFLGGLLAKSVLELIKELFKNVFKA